MKNKAIGIEDIVKEGKVIWQKCKDWKKNYEVNNPTTPMTEKDYDKLHDMIVKEHHDFASVYAVVTRRIVFSGTYYESVMRKYVQHLTNHPWKDKSEFLDRQADFFVFERRETHPREGSSQVAKFREEVRKRIHEDDKQFTEEAKKAAEIVDKEKEDAVINRKERIAQLLEQLHSGT
jgi:hypothetical protein